MFLLFLHFYSLSFTFDLFSKFQVSSLPEVSLKSIPKFHPDRHTRKRVNKNMVKNGQLNTDCDTFY